jgi:hypothetical protein
MLDIWPAFPLVIYGIVDFPTRCADNIIAALKYRDRVCHIDLAIFKTSEWEEYLAAMQQPFPELAFLRLWWKYEPGTVVVPDSVLGGFAPRLEVIELKGILFPGLPKLLLSATHLVRLYLRNIPHSGYFSPDAMAAALSTLTSLEDLMLIFISPESCPDLEIRRLPSSPRSVLPVLKFVEFKGASEYLEDLVTDIDAPQLKRLQIWFFNDVVFDTPHLSQFIGQAPILNAFENAHISLANSTACVFFRSQIDDDVELKVTILCEGSDWQLSSVEQVCTSYLPFLSTLKDLYVYEEPIFSSVDLKDNIEYRVWRELLYPFTAVKNIYLSDKFALRIGPALQELVKGRAATEVLPTLENIFLEGLESSGHVQEGIGHIRKNQSCYRR